MGPGAVTGRERLLRDGALAILPTDTVYGIGCAAGLPGACARLYEVKERPAGAADGGRVRIGSQRSTDGCSAPGLDAGARRCCRGPSR